MNDDRLNRLGIILKRALHRAEITKAAKKKVSGGKTPEQQALETQAKRAILQRLLADDFDGMRFRWYFTQIKKDTPLDELRSWIDHKIAEDK